MTIWSSTTRILFCCDNPPGSAYVSGSQDAIGIVYPGLAKAHYDGDYWPQRIDHVGQEELLAICGKLALPDPAGTAPFGI